MMQFLLTLDVISLWKKIVFILFFTFILLRLSCAHLTRHSLLLFFFSRKVNHYLLSRALPQHTILHYSNTQSKWEEDAYKRLVCLLAVVCENKSVAVGKGRTIEIGFKKKKKKPKKRREFFFVHNSFCFCRRCFLLLMLCYSHKSSTKKSLASICLRLLQPRMKRKRIALPNTHTQTQSFKQQGTTTHPKWERKSSIIRNWLCFHLLIYSSFLSSSSFSTILPFFLWRSTHKCSNVVFFSLYFCLIFFIGWSLSFHMSLLYSSALFWSFFLILLFRKYFFFWVDFVAFWSLLHFLFCFFFFPLISFVYFFITLYIRLYFRLILCCLPIYPIFSLFFFTIFIWFASFKNDSKVLSVVRNLFSWGQFSVLLMWQGHGALDPDCCLSQALY